jgi:hypothetical protein
MDDDARLGLGGNKGPDMTGTAATTTADISAFMSETPVIETAEQAGEAKTFLDRGTLCTKDLDDERKTKTYPLDKERERIFDYYRGPRELLQRVIEELRRRLTYFAAAEEARRIEIARQNAERARVSEEAAQAAEQREHQAMVEADSGVLGGDIAALAHDADTAFAEFKKAEHQAQISERETHVRINDPVGMRRAVSMRGHDVIIITDAIAFIKETGVPHNLEEPMRTVARAFKKVHGRWPAGVEVHVERKVV